MLIEIIQKNKNLFEANFEIISNDNILGEINVKGKLESMEVSLNGIYNNIPFEFKYNGGVLFKTKDKKYRPYQIIKNNDTIGEIYQTNKKTGLFSNYDYNTLFYNNNIYNEYGVGLGNESKCPIYLNDIQVAQINKDSIVYNDLHNYKIYIKEDKYSFISIIFACYMYINAGFKPGIEVKKSVVKYYNKTTNKELNSKYNPEWVKSIGDK